MTTLPYDVEYVIPPGVDPAPLATRAAALAGQIEAATVAVYGDTNADDKVRVRFKFRADCPYTARTHALFVQGSMSVESARIRRDTAIFPGRWYDLNAD